MSLRDLFKRKKPKKKPSDAAPLPKLKSVGAKTMEGEGKKEVKKVAEETKEIKKKPARVLKRKKINAKLAFRVLKAPHITEKATDLIQKNQYTFKVFLNSNKTEIKKAVAQLYNVDVLSVKIIKVPRKERRLGKISGWRKAYKKAIVKIKKGQKIEELTR